MFRSHEFSGLTEIEFYVIIQQPPESQSFDQSQVFKESTEDDHTEVEGVDEEAEGEEEEVDHMVNNNTVSNVREPLHAEQVYCPPEHMTRLNLEGDEPGMNIFYNPYTHTYGALQVGDMFRTKEDCVRAIKVHHLPLIAQMRGGTSFCVVKNLLACLD